MNQKLPFEFYVTVDCQYHFPLQPRVMMNFSSKKWKYRKQPIYPECELMMDSGGFSELNKHGEYSFTVDHYLDKLENVLHPDYFVTMDWMCEPSRLEATGLTIQNHIDKTIDNAVEIIDKWEGEAEPIIPIQGWEPEEYISCIDKIKDYGLHKEVDYYGIGSICRRDIIGEIRPVVTAVYNNLPDNAKIHAFGIKKTSFRDYDIVSKIDSADSFAWSKANRHTYDLRGKIRRFYTAQWAREAELQAYQTLLLETQYNPNNSNGNKKKRKDKRITKETKKLIEDNPNKTFKEIKEMERKINIES